MVSQRMCGTTLFAIMVDILTFSEARETAKLSQGGKLETFSPSYECDDNDRKDIR